MPFAIFVDTHDTGTVSFQTYLQLRCLIDQVEIQSSQVFGRRNPDAMT